MTTWLAWVEASRGWQVSKKIITCPCHDSMTVAIRIVVLFSRSCVVRSVSFTVSSSHLYPKNSRSFGRRLGDGSLGRWPGQNKQWPSLSKHTKQLTCLVSPLLGCSLSGVSKAIQSQIKSCTYLAALVARRTTDSSILQTDIKQTMEIIQRWKSSVLDKWTSINWKCYSNDTIAIID